jgi:hypothetical protein
MAFSDRRIAALQRTVKRRQRLEEALRAKLKQQRGELSDLCAQSDEKRAVLQRECEVRDASLQKIDSMMSGSDAFSIESLNSTVRFAGVMSDRIRLIESDLNALQQAVDAKQAEIRGTTSEISANQGRIDLCKKRQERIEKSLALAADDLADEEAEEIALSHLRALKHAESVR